MDKIFIDFDHSNGIITPNIYGHFAEHIGGVFYDGLWVGENSKTDNIHGFRKSLVESFKKIAPPILRWPGGCFAETYDWRDGIGPRAQRPRRVNWWYYEDRRIETNHVGTHEFMDFCEMVGAQPYVAANMTSLTPLQIRNWIEYCNFPAGLTTLSDERAANGAVNPFNVQYWGIGNENWGGGGQMTPEQCAREFIRYTTICRSLGTENLKFIMCGANAHDLNWTKRLMKEWATRHWQEVPTWGISIHYYTCTYSGKDDLNFDESQWYDELFRAAFMNRIIYDHRFIMDEYDPERKLKLVVDEWGNWHKNGTGPSKGYNLFEQQSNMRDAVVSALTLNIFNNACDIVGMANVAQLCNNLHSLFLAGGDSFIETPNYHVFAMYRSHQGAKHIKSSVLTSAIENNKYGELPMLSVSSSIKDQILTITIANLDITASREICISGIGRTVAGNGEITVLSTPDPMTCNTFENPTAVMPKTKPLHFADGNSITVPAASVVSLSISLSE